MQRGAKDDYFHSAVASRLYWKWCWHSHLPVRAQIRVVVAGKSTVLVGELLAPLSDETFE